MRKLFIGLMITFFLSFPVARRAAGQGRDQFRTEGRTLKARQKQERKRLKAQQKIQKRSWNSAHMTKANRV